MWPGVRIGVHRQAQRVAQQQEPIAPRQGDRFEWHFSPSAPYRSPSTSKAPRTQASASRSGLPSITSRRSTAGSRSTSVNGLGRSSGAQRSRPIGAVPAPAPINGTGAGRCESPAEWQGRPHAWC